MAGSKRLFDLENTIKTSAQKYYQDGSSDLTDAEFDAAVGELRELDPDSEVLNSVGFGYDVDLDSTPGNKVKHKYGTAGSLDKAYAYSELKNTLKSTVWASLKLDGLSVVCYYKDGALYQALTRGDGITGIDITDKVSKITPTVLMSRFTGAIRGEILMSYDNFAKFKAAHPDAKNARNSTAGIINSKSITDDIQLLNVIYYQVVGYEPEEGTFINFTSVEDVFDFLTYHFMDIGKVVPHISVDIHEPTFELQMNRLKDEWYGIYPADGIVLSTNITDINSDGYIAYDAQAFKFDSEEKQTRVIDIEWNLTKTRYLMPRVNLEPVELAGTTVRWATGYNAQYIRDNKIGPGAIVTVEKHGEIIPNINKIIEPSSEFNIPTHCPDCGSQLEWNGVHLQCVNESCSNASRQDLSVWLENIAPVEGLGDSIKFKFLEAMIGQDLSVESVIDRREDKMYFMMARGGHKLLMHNMLTQLFGSNKISAEVAIKALNIPRLGDITSTKLAQHKEIIQDIYDAAINGRQPHNHSATIGEANMKSILDNLSKFTRLKYIADRIVYPQDTLTANVECKGRVAITGKLSVPRKQLEDELRKAGYVPGEIAKDTKFLITDDPNSSSSKNKKATDWSITKITEEDFRAKYM